MTDESTLPMAGPRGPAGIACLLEPEQSDGCEGDDGRVNNSDRPPADMEVDATRGRARERGSAHRTERHNNDFDKKLLNDAASAAAALSAALGPVPSRGRSSPQATVPEGEGSLDSVRNLHDASPEKKPRLTSKMPAPPQAPSFGGSATTTYPPLWHGNPGPAAAPTPGLPSAGPQPHPPASGAPAPAPEHFHLDEPSWVAGLRHELRNLVHNQQNMSAQLLESGRHLQGIKDEIRELGTGQDALSRRADAQEHSMQQMRAEMKELEKELQALKSAPPTRSVSPAPSRVGGTGTPRSEAQGYRPSGEVDELQIVIGGWNECRRDHIEQDVQDIFGRMNGNALVKQVFIPYVRCGYCRVEINYPEPDIWKMRKLQGVIVQAIKELGFTSTSPGQERCKFWATRNRSIQDRAKVRAVISTWELCVRHVGDACADKDWRGKVWVNSVQVLHHVDTRPRPEDTLMLLDSRGTETGWFLDIVQMQACLGISRDAILAHYGLG